MPIESPRRQLYNLAAQYGAMLEPAAGNQVLVQTPEPQRLLELAGRLASDHFYLVTVVANDERELEDHCFKIYYLFSPPEADLFLTVEHPLEPGQETYSSLYPHFPAVDPFEREIRDLLGLIPAGDRRQAVEPGSRLHQPYPAGLYPLRRDQTTADIKQRVAEAFQKSTGSSPVPRPGRGRLSLPVGPVHAGIIEPGRFVFEVAGEVIDELTICLGYTHKGIERLFQAHTSLADGWRLAEQVSGDSSFAHSLAYCHAAEALAGVEVAEPAQLLRGLFLELERIANHIGDLAALVHDVAFDLIAPELAVLREELLRLNAALAGQRFLRGLNRPGGLILPQPLDARRIRSTLESCLNRFNPLVNNLISTDRFRDRAIETGILTYTDALKLGATGLVARAAGLRRDYRRDHPSGVYSRSWLQERFDQANERGLEADFTPEAGSGDVYARFLTRAQEVTIAAEVIDDILKRWTGRPERAETCFLTELRFEPARNYTFALGYAEGWRGDVVYWLMQDKLGRIYRCKVRDPSLLNWPALRQAMIPHQVEGKMVETTLADFPLINKSFNLSYSGNDL